MEVFKDELPGSGKHTPSLNGRQRQPLQDLPATPLNPSVRLDVNTKRPAPLRIASSPTSPVTPQSSGTQASEEADLLTPPTTPLRPKTWRSPASADGLSGFDGLEISVPGIDELLEIKEAKVQVSEVERKEISWEDTVPKPYTKDYEPLRKGSEYGHGVWSTVYAAIESNPPLDEKSTSLSGDIPTPPTSPLTTALGDSVSSPSPLPIIQSRTTTSTALSKILAIKSPIRRDAHKVLAHEARVLTYLHQSMKTPRASTYIVPFHGYNSVEHSLVLTAIPLNLDTLAKDSLRTVTARKIPTTDPVIGLETWKTIARDLVSGLEYLHSRNCVHGDIKPANILLEPFPTTTNEGGELTYKPLYCDFSSSRIPSPSSPHEEEEEISAVTTTYSSPELLESFYHRNSASTRAIATFASDIFALGVTLLVAATGENPYSLARIELQKTSMAREGRVLYYARMVEQAGRRVERGGVVERGLGSSLEGDVGRRGSVRGWKEVLEGL
ncbi:hypothetical protein MMC09_006726 [Bachmanniomyces sp. S44760]|nr:hypothetical protein [Bachmanniomyces sp. S44760]